MKRGLLLLLLLAMAISVQARDYPTDPEWAKVEEEIEKEKKRRCGKIKSTFEELDCRGEVIDDYTDKGVYRGSEEYADKHYKPLEDQALFDKWRELKEQHEKARRFVSSPKPGELDKRMLENEQGYIQEILFNRWKGQGRDPWREWHRLAKDGLVVD